MPVSVSPEGPGASVIQLFVSGLRYLSHGPRWGRGGCILGERHFLPAPDLGATIFPLVVPQHLLPDLVFATCARLGEVSKAAFRLNLRTLLRRAQPKSLDLNHALNFVQFVLDEIAQQAALQCIVILDLGGKSRIYDE